MVLSFKHMGFALLNKNHNLLYYIFQRIFIVDYKGIFKSNT